MQNQSFEDGWTDLPPAPGNLINQQPYDWILTWVEPGQPLFDHDEAKGVPECVHKLVTQLPPEEQPGGSDPLILDGEAVYKIFHHAAAFGAELRQLVTGLKPSTTAYITVPIRMHRHGDPDDYGAEAGVWLNGTGGWVHSGNSGDRQWHNHEHSVIVPGSGAVEVVIRVKSKWDRPKDFFIDAIQFVGTPDGDSPPPPPGDVEERLAAVEAGVAENKSELVALAERVATLEESLVGEGFFLKPGRPRY